MCQILAENVIQARSEALEVLDFCFANQTATIRCTAKTTGKTGVEMEALTGANIAALTLYDMCKALDKGITIQSVRVLLKSGGKSDYQAGDQPT